MSGPLLSSRRRMLSRFGRGLTLQRPNDSPPPSDLPVQGYPTMVKPNSLRPPETQNTATVAILNDEIAAAGWPNPNQGTNVVIDGITWAVVDAAPVYEGTALIGWTLLATGGQP